MIVLADADLERAANAATYYSMQNGGQTCISVERVYVEAPVYDEFVSKVTDEGRRRCARACRPGRAASTSAPSRSRSSSTSSPATSTPRARPAPRVLTRRPRRHRHGRALLRADRARRRRPLDGVHDRGDVRADAADHERRGRRGGAQARQRLVLRARRLGLDEGRRARRGARAPDRGGRGLRQRRAAELPRARAADGRLEGLRARLAPRRRRHPQVHPPAVAAGDAARAQARPAHVPVQGRHDRPARPRR